MSLKSYRVTFILCLLLLCRYRVTFVLCLLFVSLWKLKFHFKAIVSLSCHFKAIVSLSCHFESYNVTLIAIMSLSCRYRVTFVPCLLKIKCCFITLTLFLNISTRVWHFVSRRCWVWRWEPAIVWQYASTIWASVTSPPWTQWRPPKTPKRAKTVCKFIFIKTWFTLKPCVE
jgi:hypothetical protein